MHKQLDLSIVVPSFNEEESIPELFDWILRVCTDNTIAFEVIFVDDGSNDGTWDAVKKMQSQHEQVKGIKFRRNYGKSAALNEGFKAAEGKVVMTMDADLQDSPDEIPGMMAMINDEGYHLVSGWKKKRYDPITKTIPTKFFNAATRYMSGIKLNDFNCGLKAYQKSLVKSIEVYGEMHRYIPVLAKWAGFPKIGEKVVEHRARKYGSTKFGLERFVNGFLDLLTITFVSRFGKKPMHFFGLIGMLMFFFGVAVSVFMGGQKLYFISLQKPAPLITDQPLFYLAITSAIVGTQLFLTGFVAELVSRSASDRNKYLIEEKF